MAAGDPRFDSGLLDISDAARFLGVPRTTLQRWAHGAAGEPPLLDVLQVPRPRAQVTFIALAEAHVLEALRRAGVRTGRIRPALQRLAEEFGHRHVLVARELATDGIDVLWDFSRSREGADLMDGRTGQLVLRGIVGDYVHYLTWAEDGYPRRLELPHCQPSRVLVDPYRAFGQPVFAGSRTRVRDVASMLAAGEDAQVVADEHGVSVEEVRTAARVLLSRAA